MSAKRNNDDLLRLVADGRLDALRPDEVAALEKHLLADLRAADACASVPPEPDPLFASTPVPLPTESSWQGVWREIERAAREKHTPVRSLGWRLWPPIMAAAACVLVLTSWFSRPAGTAGAADSLLATNVEVLELEVFGDETPMVVATGDHGAAIIWVLDESEGAGT